MEGTQAAEIAVELLRLQREEVGIEQVRGIRMRRVLEDGRVADDERRALRRIDRFEL